MLGEHTGLQDMGVAAGCTRKRVLGSQTESLQPIADFNSVRHYARRQGMITPCRDVSLQPPFWLIELAS